MGSFLIAKVTFSLAAAIKKYVAQFEGVPDTVQARLAEGSRLSRMNLKEFKGANQMRQPVLNQPKAPKTAAPVDITSALTLTLKKAATRLGFDKVEREFSAGGQNYLTLHNRFEKGVTFTYITNSQDPTLAINPVGHKGKQACDKALKELTQALQEEGLPLEEIFLQIDHGDPRGVTRQQVKTAIEKQKTEVKQPVQERSKSDERKIHERQAVLHRRKLLSHGR